MPIVAEVASDDAVTVARAVVRSSFGDGMGGRGLVWWSGSFWHWNAGRWRQLQWERAVDEVWTATADLVVVRVRDGDEERRRWAPTRQRVGDVMAAMRAMASVGDRQAPFVLSGAPVDPEVAWRLVTMEDCVVDLGTGEAVERGPGWFDVSVVPTRWADRGAPCPTWERCVREWSGGDAVWEECLRRMMGYCMMGWRGLHKWFLMYGRVRSGKGTIMHVLGRLCGSGFKGVTLDVFHQDHGLSACLGARVLSVGEVGELTGRQGETVCRTVKSVTTGDPLSVRVMYQTPLTGVVLGAVVVMQANEIPTLPDSMDGLTSKMVLLPFETSFLDREDTRLKEKLEAELPGIAGWALEGARRIVEDPDPKRAIPITSRARGVIETFKDQGSPVRVWMEGMFEPSRGDWIGSTTLTKLWRRDNPGSSMGATTLIRKVIESSPWPVERWKSNGERRVKGLKLKHVSDREGE